MAVLPVRACPGGRRGPAAGTIGSSSIPCSQDGFSHGSCNRPAGRDDRSPPPGPRPQSPPYPADHRAATGTEPGGRDRGRAGPPAARPRPSRAGRVVRGRSGLVPAADDPDQARALVVDGAPVPCRDRKHEPGPHSGRHHRAGPGLQDACTPAGRPVRVPGPAPGSTHDARAPQRTGLLDNSPDTPPLGDEGCIGSGMTTPIRRPAGGEPVDRQKQHDKIINSSRAPVERATAQ